MAGKNVHEFTDANFKSEVEQADLPVLVDFWAPWCGPCRAVGPAVEAIADDYAGRLKVGKVNVDDNQNVALTYGISAIPAIFLFKDGDVVERIIGARPKGQIAQVVDRHV
jgi:thioredoxin 1